MLKFCFLLVLCCEMCASVDDGDLGYSLKIGHAIDVFANYGDLSQVTQVVSADYEEEDDAEPIKPFREKNIKIFSNATYQEVDKDYLAGSISIQFCDTFDDLLNAYFQDFQIEGTTKTWKAFMGDWVTDEILRTFGLEFETGPDSCFVLLKLAKPGKNVTMNELTDVDIKDYVKRAIEDLNGRNSTELRKFMKNYGTHYIQSYVTGNFMYQVFKFKPSGYNLLKAYTRRKSYTNGDNLRFNFASFFLKQVGDIRVASGNKTVENWARLNLRDKQYQYSRPSLLKLYYNPILVNKLNDLLDNSALLSLNLKTLKPIFNDGNTGEMFAEIVENDLQLWEINV